MTNWLRVLFGLVLLAGAYVLAIAVILLNVGIATAPVLLGLLWKASFIALPVIVGPLTVISITNVLAIGIAVVTASRKSAEPWTSVRIPDSDAPELMAIISGIAATSRAPVPAELGLVAEANAAVSENPRVFGFGPATRRLYLGLPILIGMSRSQLEAILSHEIGHYAGGHSRFGAVVHRGAISLAAVCTVLRMVQASDPAASSGVTRKIVWAIQREYVALDYKIFSGYAWLYNRLFFFVRRAQEYEADRIAAHIVGGAELAAALRRAYALSAAWSDFQNRFLRPMRGVRCVPHDPFDAFGQMLTDPGYQDALREWAASPPEQPTTPLDSHPCLADRLARLSGLRDRSGGAGPEPAVTLLPLLPDRPWISQLTEVTQAGKAMADSLPWDECVNRLGQTRAAQPANRLLRAVAAVSSAGAAGGGGASTAAGVPTLGHVLDLVQTRRGELAAAVAYTGSGRASREDPLTPLATGLLALLGCVMVASGRVRWQATWQGDGDPLRLAAEDSADAGVAQMRDLVNSFVADPGSANADAITLCLLSLGINPNVPVRLTFAGLDAAASTVPGPGAPGGTLVIHPALDPRRDRLQPVVRAVGIAALLTVTVVGAISRSSHAPAPQYPTAGERTPSYEQFAPDYGRQGLILPTPTLFPRLALPSAIIAPPIPEQDLACAVFAKGARCTVITIQHGDSLSLLACRYRTSVKDLQGLNFLRASTAIKAGQRLLVPDPKDGPAACG